MNQPKNTVVQLRPDELTEPLAHQIANLAARSFTTSHRTIEQRISELLESRQKRDSVTQSQRRFVVLQGDKVVAHANTFVRTIHFEEVSIESARSLDVLALATVCSDPEMRGQGLGAVVTEAAFGRVGQGDHPTVSLFQTPVPVFYEKLGCGLVTNRFVDRTELKNGEANPWRDDTIMIYPAAHSWHDGVIDLNGPDY